MKKKSVQLLVIAAGQCLITLAVALPVLNGAQLGDAPSCSAPLVLQYASAVLTFPAVWVAFLLLGVSPVPDAARLPLLLMSLPLNGALWSFGLLWVSGMVNLVKSERPHFWRDVVVVAIIVAALVWLIRSPLAAVIPFFRDDSMIGLLTALIVISLLTILVLLSRAASRKQTETQNKVLDATSL